ncbi:transcriptional regulator [Bacillus pseudomycoides]|uniref:helix-turn-helix domain-containing protein n=1 Tax=Bacillus pseudomycoides TaxID=64104 RepID=UPI000BF81DDD|nr:helix-turn-helix domain-containing protein [Bacillus pseudomycoides]PGD77088.1 transcriptional regulator [Bacillus pseudomycoides]
MKELRKYETFKSIAEMDNSIDLYLKKYTLKDSERVILLALSRYSCKFVGVSYLKNATLSEVTGLSVRTIQRAYNRLSLLGIVVRHEQFKPVKGGHSAFITVIQPFESHTALSFCEEDDKPSRGNDEEPPHENETITHKANPNNKYIRKNNTIEMDTTYLESSHVPTEFINAVSPFFGTANEVYSLWGKVLLAHKKHAPSLLELTEVAVSSFKQSVFAMKMNRIKKGFKGYYYGILANMFTVEQRRINRVNLVDWLN